jgi:hypothetical protein
MATPVKKVSLFFGVAFLLFGILGFVAGSASMTSAPLLGLFHVNLAHNILHIAFGLWALVAARSEKGAESFAQIAGVIFLILALLGFFTPTGFGKLPLGNHNIWLHAIFGLVLIYFGFGSLVDRDDVGQVRA